MPITAEEARAQLVGLNQKKVDQIPEMLKKLARETHFRIYNVGPFRWIREMGSMGTWTILQPDPETGISPPLKVPAILFETVPEDIDKMKQVPHDGRQFVDDLLGVGKFKNESQNLVKWGVFFTEGTEPTEAQLEAAHMQVLERCKDLVQQADAYEAQGPNHLVNITEQHRWAAKQLNVEKSWCKETRAMIDCPGCGERVLPTITRHQACGWVFDIDRAVAGGLLNKAQAAEMKRLRGEAKE